MKNWIIAVLVLTNLWTGFLLQSANSGASSFKAHANVKNLRIDESAGGAFDKLGAEMERAAYDSAQRLTRRPSQEVSETSIPERLKTFRQSPLFFQIKTQEAKLAIDEQFAAFFRMFPLLPQDRERLKDLLVEMKLIALDIEYARNELGETQLPVEKVAELQANAQRQIATQVAELLGSENMAMFNGYSASLTERRQLRPLVERMSYETEPLSDTQFNTVVTLLAKMKDNARQQNRGVVPFGEAPELAQERYDQVMQAAASTLSPAQIAIAKEFFAEQIELRRLLGQLAQAPKKGP